ncbi:hypothetical protein GBA52_022261 [Prunus armeniaca]|nr:hypothetical protein GBA52_022261 [Prunus armeniaca]
MASFYNEISLHRRSDVQFSSPPSPTSPPIVPYSFGEKRRGPLRDGLALNSNPVQSRDTWVYKLV